MLSRARNFAGGNLEGILRHKVDATGNPTSTTVGASFMNWRGDIALGGNAQARLILQTPNARRIRGLDTH